MPNETEQTGRGVVEGIIDALSDKHSQVDLRLQDVTLALGDSRLALKLSGSVTVTIHMRDLTEAEKDAHVQANIKAIRS